MVVQVAQKGTANMGDRKLKDVTRLTNLPRRFFKVEMACMVNTSSLCAPAYP